MAIVRVYDFPSATLAQYDQVMAKFDNQLAPGNLLHAAGAFGQGFRAIDVFESREAAESVAAMIAGASRNSHSGSQPSPKFHSSSRPAGTVSLTASLWRSIAAIRSAGSAFRGANAAGPVQNMRSTSAR